MRNNKILCVMLVTLLAIILPLSAIALGSDRDGTQQIMSQNRHKEARYEIWDAELYAAFRAYIYALFGEDYFENEQQAVRDIEELRRGFGRTRSGNIMYPDYFGGAYINDDGHMVMLIVEDNINAARDYVAVRSGRYRVVEFSYAELNEVFEVAVDRFIYRLNSGCIYARNIEGGGLRIMDNVVAFYITYYNDEMIAWFRQYIHCSPIIELRQG